MFIRSGAGHPTPSLPPWQTISFLCVYLRTSTQRFIQYARIKICIPVMGFCVLCFSMCARMCGHVSVLGQRMGLLALRPAPVQITYLALATTTGNTSRANNSSFRVDWTFFKFSRCQFHRLYGCWQSCCKRWWRKWLFRSTSVYATFVNARHTSHKGCLISYCSKHYLGTKSILAAIAPGIIYSIIDSCMEKWNEFQMKTGDGLSQEIRSVRATDLLLFSVFAISQIHLDTSRVVNLCLIFTPQVRVFKTPGQISFL